MSLQQQAAASGATAGNTGDTPLSPSNPSESKRRRTSEGDAEADAALDLEEAIRRSLEDADAGGSGANHSAGGPSTAAGGPSTAAGGPSTAANPFAAFFGPSGAGDGTAPAASSNSPAIDAAALARAFAAAAADATPNSAHPANPASPPPTDPHLSSRPAADARDAHRVSGVAVQSPPFPEADDEWWRADAVDASATDDDEPITCADAASACAALSEMLDAPVAAPGAPSSAGAAAVQIVLVRGALTDKVLDAAVKSRLSPGRLKTASMCRVAGDLHRRAEGFASKASSEATESETSTVALSIARRLRRKLAAHVLRQLEDDGDDLYFEGGRHRGDFLDAVGVGAASRAMIEDMLDATKTKDAARAWIETIRKAFAIIAATPLDAVDGLEVPSRALDALTDAPRLATALSAELARESSSAALESRGAESPASGCVFGAAMARNAAAMLVAGPRGKVTLHSASNAPSLFSDSLRRYPECPPGDREKLGWIAQRSVKATHDVLHGVLLKIVRKRGAHMERVLTWLAAATRACERGADARATHRGEAFWDERRRTDDFHVGVAAVALRFARPVVAGAETLLEQRLMDLAPLRHNWRHDWAADAALARVDAVAAGARVDAAPNEPPPFVAECFYASTRAFSRCLLPVVRRFEEGSRVLADRARARSETGNEGEGGGEGAGGVSYASALARDVKYNAHLDCATTALLDPELAADACGLASLQAAWMTRLARELDPESAKRAFACIPEDCAKGVAEWVRFVIRAGKAEYLLGNGGGGGGASPLSSPLASPTAPASGSASKPRSTTTLGVRALVAFACELLSRPDVARHPVVRAELVEMLESMLVGEGGRRSNNGALGVRGSATHELLVSSVLGAPETRRSLCPALIRAYSVMDAVEGLDVDRDRFDKFHSRDVIARLLEELWRIDECVESVARLGETSDGKRLFDDFAGCVLGDLMYVLQDSLDRLASVAEMERAMADADAWAALTRRDREEKERFLRGQERAAKGFMRNATRTLALLNLLASSESVAPAFVRSDVVAGRAAYAVVRFLESLLGPSAVARTSVADPKKYGFDPKRLVSAIVEFTVRLDGVAGGFAERLAAEEDYDAGVMEAARDVLVRDAFGAAFVPPRLRDIIDRCARIRGEEGREDGGGSSMHGGDEMKDAASASPRDGTTSGEGSWSSSALLSLLGPDPYPDESAEETAYKSTMGPKTFAEADGGTPIEGFFSQFDAADRADAGAAPSRAKQKKLAREAAALAEGQLPCELGSSVFLRHDPDRFDRQRAVIVGPEGTPYAGGAFVFDVYFPAGYPASPPMLNLDTTGGGRVRFNPNLYADGKVCLSLLGTWHGGALEEKWDPKTSTLYQVLVSVQGLILVDDPMFNEPGFDGLRGTPEGRKKSAAHNEEIRLHTVRHAMIDHLKKPRSGVADVVRQHFRLRRWSIMRQVVRWCEEAEDPVARRRTRDAANELAKLLAELGADDEQERSRGEA